MDEKKVTGAGQTSAPGGIPGGRVQGSQDRSGQAQGESTGSVADRAKSTLGTAASSAADAAASAYDQGRRYAHRAGEGYQQARRYYEEGTRTVGRQVAEAPLLSLLAVGAIGYGLAWMVHTGRTGWELPMPHRARRRRDYPGELSGKPLIESDRVEGTAVYDPDGNQVGTIRRVMIEKISGRVAYAVMSFGGFLGIGADEYAIPWSKLDYDPSLEGYRTDITEEQLRNAPNFSRERSDDWANRQREEELHDYYRVSYYWLLP